MHYILFNFKDNVCILKNLKNFKIFKIFKLYFKVLPFEYYSNFHRAEFWPETEVVYLMSQNNQLA